ncbi:MAG: hypothetical protein SFV19_06080 [Rhodospirillaceae bacterium]|nr:hypothetical protein [Rhodospirillaceae bacterium]
MTADVTALGRAPNLSAQQDDIRALVRAMTALTGLSASALATQAGLTPSTLNRFLHGEVRHTLSQRTLLALMTATFTALDRRPVAALDTTALQRLLSAVPVFERAIIERAPEAARTLKEMRLKAGSAPLPAAARAPEARDLPVLSAASRNVEIAAGRFDAAPMMTQRPPFLADDDRAFAFLVTDATLAPRYDAGDLLYAATTQNVAPGMDAVIERKSGGFLVGRLTETAEFVLPLAPGSGAIAKADIKGLYRIVGVQRLGG